MHIRRRTRNNPIDLGWSDAITETPPPRSKLITWTDAHTTGKREACKQTLLLKSPWLLLWMTSPIGRLEILLRWKTNLAKSLIYSTRVESTFPNELFGRSFDSQKCHPSVRSFVPFDGCCCCFSMFRLLWKPILWTPDTRLESEVYTNDWTTSLETEKLDYWISLCKTPANAIAFWWFVFLLNGERKLCNRPFSLSSLSLPFVVVHTNIIKGILWDSITVGKRVPLPSTY